MANVRAGCRALTDFLKTQGNTVDEVNAIGIQGGQIVTLTFSLDAAARMGRVAKGGKKKAAKGRKKTAKGGKKAR